MNLPRCIYIPAVEHTGAWFLIELLGYHSNVVTTSILEFADFLDNPKWREVAMQPHTCVISHSLFGPCLSGGVKYTTEEETEICLQMADRIIVPVSDPLLSLLVAHVEQPDKSHTHIVDGFLKLVEWTQVYNKMAFVQVDLYLDRLVMERYVLLRSLFGFCGLPYEPYMSYWAQEWPLNLLNDSHYAENVAVDYYMRDVRKLIKHIPDDFKYLKAHENELRPFLHSINYRKLIWWGA